jgi:hypothetical protein
MVALLFTAIFIVGLLAISLYFLAPRAKSSEAGLLPPPEPPRGLFGNKDAFESAVPQLPDPGEREALRNSLRERAKSGDKSALDEAHSLGENELYDEVLDQLIAGADSAPTLLDLVSYVTRSELPVTVRLAEAIISSWQVSPDRRSTATTLHLTALADDASLYQSTVEAALNFWRQGLLADVSAAELRALVDGEFWVLSSRTRSSGAGFLLKRKLASARRELETAMRAN